jgi:hypothetical protein
LNDLSKTMTEAETPQQRGLSVDKSNTEQSRSYLKNIFGGCNNGFWPGSSQKGAPHTLPRMRRTFLVRSRLKIRCFAAKPIFEIASSAIAILRQNFLTVLCMSERFLLSKKKSHK